MSIKRICYIAPRYHTNQVPIVRGLISKGYEVCFLSQYVGGVEDHSDIEPHVLGYSKVYLFMNTLVSKLRHLDIKVQNDIRMKHGFPPFGAVRKELIAFKPDIVILRERSVYTIAAYQVCKRMHIPAILYNQSPLYEDVIKNDIPHRIVRALVPDIRMTPVYGEGREDQVIEPGSIYVPFVMPLNFDPNEREWNKDGVLHVFTVGKYEKRKNLIMMCKAVARVNQLLAHPIHLTIAGECTSEGHRLYFEGVKKFVEGNASVNRSTELLRNLSSAEMAEQYKNADLFVIPSTNEPASISQLEAMSYGLPVICSDKNGTAHMIEEDINGYHFEDCNEDDLVACIMRFVEDISLCQKMGNCSYRLVRDKYNIDTYIEGIHV